MKDIFAVYKPKGPSSNAVVQQIKNITGIKKVGHAGTLDPLAQGVLVIGVGRDATKRLAEVVKKEKEYLVIVRLGVQSATDDEEGKKTEIPVAKHPATSDIERVLRKFQGKILQTPPVFSAVKIKGKEAYKHARMGQHVVLEPRPVEIKEIRLLEYTWPTLHLKVTTGPGVYIRSLARDIGKELGTGGYVQELERTRVGDFSKEDAIKISQIRIP